MAGFRVLVNLSNYFSDFRKKSWVYVDPNRFKTLLDLKRHICDVFTIDDDFEVFVCGSYIPSREDVGIINEKDVLELKKSTGNADTEPLKDLFCAPISLEEGDRRKSRKKRKSSNIDSQLDTDQSFDNVDPLPENFNPECNSTMASRKKRKKNRSSSPLKKFLGSPSAENCKELGKKKSNVLKENHVSATEMHSTVQISDEGIEKTTPVCTNMEQEKNSVASLSTKLCSVTSLDDFQKVNNSSEVKGEADSMNCSVISAAKSTFDNSLLEHTVYEGAGDVAEREGEIAVIPFQKKKRHRRAKRKHKKISSNNLPVSNHADHVLNADVFSSKLSDISVVSNSGKHMRFSDSGEEEEVSAHLTAGDDSVFVCRRNEYSHNVVNGSASVEVEMCSKPSLNVSKAFFVNEASVGDEKVKDGDVEIHDQVSGEILKYASTNGGKNAKTACKSSQSSPLPIGGWRKKTVLNTGLGATLAHLMKDLKTTESCISNSKTLNLKAIDNIQPPLSVPDKPCLSNKNYCEFPIIEKFPREKDILAFKTLKMNDHYEPCISDFIECVVIACDQDQSVVTMRIIEGAKEFDRVSGKFEIQLDGEEEKTESQDMVLTMEWKDIIEPRLIFP